ncbi:hypothetical protein AYO41_04070 [Verrucomicrobia bacterium SCGC AG-212-E04]|nr:hypothetical protein AYO41_04070 [Verrucomicrobia bacterium SCGC AG-212-E04]
MKIVFLSTILRYPWGGADMLWTRAAEASSERDDQLLLFLSPLVRHHPRVEALVNAGAELKILANRHEPLSLPRRALRKISTVVSRRDPIVQRLGAFAPDLVVVSCGGTYDLLLEPALTKWLQATRTPFRIVANWQCEHPYLSDADTESITSIFAAAADIFFVSARNCEVTRRHLGVPLSNASVIQNPLRWTQDDCGEWPNEDVWTLGAVSRLAPEKGIDLLIHAASAALGLQEDWVLRVHGEGPELSRLNRICHQLGLQGRVKFVGHVPALATIWSSTHILVSPAIDDGVPMTIPEAMLCARPVLATCVGGAEDWIVHGRSGFLCPASTLPLLTTALADAWAQRANWRTMGEAAAIDARRHYQPDDYLRLIE